MLYAFRGGIDGGRPEGNLLFDGKSSFFGLAGIGGDLNCNGGCGVAYQLTLVPKAQ